MRSSLSAIGLAGETLQSLLKGPLTDDKWSTVQEVTAILSSSVDKSSALVEDLLALAKAGQVPKHVDEVDLNEIVRRVLEERAVDIEQKGITVQVDDTMGHVSADTTHMYQLFSNLINNAIRFSDRDNLLIEISYLGDDAAGGHRYIVRDNSSGIQPEYFDDIFTPFFKGDESDGAGIGLSTVKKVVDVYDGEIRAYNDNGACFEFVIRDYGRGRISSE